MANPSDLHIKRLVSLGFGGSLTLTSSFLILKLLSIPSFFASFIGMGGMVDLTAGLAGGLGGFLLYLQLCKKLNIWPLTAQPRGMGFPFLSRGSEPSRYSEFKAAVKSIEEELMSLSQEQVRTEVVKSLKDHSSYFLFLLTAHRQEPPEQEQSVFNLRTWWPKRNS